MFSFPLILSLSPLQFFSPPSSFVVMFTFPLIPLFQFFSPLCSFVAMFSFPLTFPSSIFHFIFICCHHLLQFFHSLNPLLSCSPLTLPPSFFYSILICCHVTLPLSFFTHWTFIGCHVFAPTPSNLPPFTVRVGTAEGDVRGGSLCQPEYRERR